MLPTWLPASAAGVTALHDLGFYQVLESVEVGGAEAQKLAVQQAAASREAAHLLYLGDDSRFTAVRDKPRRRKGRQPTPMMEEPWRVRCSAA
jgi:hypothetical protein